MDPRIARTRTLLQDALLALARERDLDEISIADIADRATINRSTFYQHYADKDTLLADALDAQAIRAGADLADLADPAVLALSEEPPAMLVRYAEHLAENAALYRRVLGEHGSPAATARLRRRISAIVTTGMCSHQDDLEWDGMPVEIAAASITGSLIGVLTTWLDMLPMPTPERAAAWAWTMLAPNKPTVAPA